MGARATEPDAVTAGGGWSRCCAALRQGWKTCRHAVPGSAAAGAISGEPVTLPVSAIGARASDPAAVMTGAGCTRAPAARRQGWYCRRHAGPGVAAGGAIAGEALSPPETAIGAMPTPPDTMTTGAGCTLAVAARLHGWKTRTQEGAGKAAVAGASGGAASVTAPASVMGASAAEPAAVMVAGGSACAWTPPRQNWNWRRQVSPGAAAVGTATVATTAEAVTAMGARAADPVQVMTAGGWTLAPAARRHGWKTRFHAGPGRAVAGAISGDALSLPDTAIGARAIEPDAVITGGGNARSCAARIHGWNTLCHDGPGAAASGAAPAGTTMPEAVSAMGTRATDPVQVMTGAGWTRCCAALRRGWKCRCHAGPGSAAAGA